MRRGEAFEISGEMTEHGVRYVVVGTKTDQSRRRVPLPGAIIRPARFRSIRCAWGLIPYWCQDPKGGRKPINAKCETVDRLPMFREAYRRRRCIVPVDGFYEWKAIKGAKAKQPYAIAMKDGQPFGIGGLWENWKDPTSGEWIRTFAVITTDANEVVAAIHDRMPLILAPGEYTRWLGEEADPRDLLRPFPAEPMRIWPISARVNKPENDDPSVLEPVTLTSSAA
jgi:putative SOS response-associated peptidase YedK